MKENLPPNLPRPGEEYEIPPQGSLGLLAIGYKGLLLWRKKRAEYVLNASKKANEMKKTGDEGK